jgi:hypothetical protein
MEYVIQDLQILISSEGLVDLCSVSHSYFHFSMTVHGVRLKFMEYVIQDLQILILSEGLVDLCHKYDAI